MMRLPFHDREDAARRLAAALMHYRGQHPLVLAIPRGAVPMGRIVADALDGELDIVLVRKLGAPGNPELAIGAMDEQGNVMLNEHASWVGADERYVRREAQLQQALIRERRMRYRPEQAALALAGRVVIVMDDGLATGATMKAALRAARAQRPQRLVCAVPVAARDSLEEVERLADEVVCLATPSPFGAVGLYYEDFRAVGDEDVMQALAVSPLAPASASEVRIPVGTVTLEGDLILPAAAQGLVVFAHGSGSSRHSVRNRFVASALNQRGLGTLLFDLLTPREDVVSSRFDIALLAQRLEAAVQWARMDPGCRGLPIALFGASTGAAAALTVAAALPGQVAAVVSRGGRPDLAGTQVLSQIHTPTLLIVGGADREVLELNRHAQAAIGAWAELTVVPGATHLFEEPGALEQVASTAGDWLVRRVGGGDSATGRAVGT